MTEPVEQFTEVLGMLTEELAQKISYSVNKNTGEETLVRSWPDVGIDYHSKCCRFLRKTTSVKNGKGDKAAYVVEAPQADHQPYPGIWRQVSVDVSKQAQGFPGVMQTLRKGYAAALNWDEALLFSHVQAPSNSSSVAGVSETASDNPVIVIVVRFPNLDPTKIRTIQASLAATTVLHNPTIQGEEFTGDWHLIVSSAERAEDGSGRLDIMFGHPQFTVNTYENTNTIAENSVGNLWEVPEALAQAIVTAWDSATETGRTAHCSYNVSRRTCDITLIGKVAAKQNLTTDWISISCKRQRRWHFAWGYTKAEIYTPAVVAPPAAASGFLYDHSEAIPGTGNAQEGWTRDVQVSAPRGDGLYDAIVVETRFGPNADPATPDFSITLPIGTKITRTLSYGYDLRKSELATVKAAYEAYAAEGYSLDWQLTRDDDCSFDYRAEATRKTGAIQRTLQAGQSPADGDGLTHGVRTKSWSVKNATAAELAALEASLIQAPRKSIDVDVTADDDETSNVKVKEREVQKTETTLDIPKGATQGIGVKIKAGRNVGIAEIAALATTFASGARKSINVRLDADDAGEITYTVSQAEVQKVEQEVSASASTSGVGVRQKAGKNVDAAEVIAAVALFPPSARHHITLTLDPQDDNTFNYRITEETVQLVEGEVNIPMGTQGTGLRQKAGANVDAAQLVALLTEFPSGARKEVSLTLEPQDDKTWKYRITEATTQKVQEDIEVKMPTGPNGQGTGIQVFHGRSVDPADLATIVTNLAGGKPRVRIDLVLSANPDKTLNYGATRVEVQKGEGQLSIPIGATSGTGVKVASGRNVDPAELVAIVAQFTSTARKRHDITLQVNEDKTFDYVIVERTVQEVAVSQNTIITANGGSVTDPGVTVAAYMGKNASVLPTINRAPRVRPSLGITVNDDKTFDYLYTLTTVCEVKESWNVTGTGIATELHYGKNVSIADVPSVASAIRKRVSVNISPNDDKTVDYAIRVDLIVATNGSVSLPAGATLYYGANADAIPGLPATGYVLRSISVNVADDGAKTYSAVIEPLTVAILTTQDAPAKNKRYLEVGINKDSVPTTPTKGTVIISASASEGQNGKFNYVFVTEDIEEVVVEVTDHGVDGIRESNSAGINATTPPSPLSGRKVRDTVEVSPTKEGLANWKRSKVEIVEEDQTVRLGTKAEHIDLRVGRNRPADALKELAYPTATGEAIDGELVLDDAGNLHFHVVQKRKQAGGASITSKGGSYSVAEEITAVDGNPTIADLDGSAAVKQGTRILFTLRVDKDGAASYTKAVQTSTPRTADVFPWEHLKHRSKQNFTESAVPFDHVVTLAAASPYFSLVQFRVEEDFTFSGVIVYRTYSGEVWPDLTVPFRSPQTKNTRYVEYYTIGGKRYYQIVYLHECYLWDTHFPNIMDYLDEQTHPNKIDGNWKMMQINGNDIFFAQRTDLDTSRGTNGYGDVTEVPGQ